MEGRTLRSEEFARDIEGLSADNDDLLAIEELLGSDTGEATKQVALAIDHDLGKLQVSDNIPQITPQTNNGGEFAAIRALS